MNPVKPLKLELPIGFPDFLECGHLDRVTMVGNSVQVNIEHSLGSCWCSYQ